MKMSEEVIKRDQDYSPSVEDQTEAAENPSSIQSATVGHKRQNSDRGRGEPASKKANFDGEEENVQVKVLIPSAAVGAIIGRGGETMRSLKSESGCRVQMSKNQELYQGTNERICVVKGKILSVMKVLEVMMEKIREKVDPNTPADPFDHKGVQRIKEMKFLVPNSSAGMVIGKSGARIKEIRDQTGANIQVYPKAGSYEAKAGQERVITIAAEDNDALMSAIHRVLEKIAADPLHATPVDHKDLDTSSYGGRGSIGQGGPQPIQPFDFVSRQSGGGQFSSPQSQFMQGSSTQVWQPNQQRVLDASYSTISNSNGMAAAVSNFNPVKSIGNAELLAFLDCLQSTLRTSGFNEANISEVMQAMQVLAKYNIMSLGLGLGVAAMAQVRSCEPSVQQQLVMQAQRYDASANITGGGIIEGSDRQFPHGGQNDLNKSLSGVSGVLIDVMNQNKSGGTKSDEPNFASTVIKEKVVENGLVELEIPDNIIGAVLGPKGKTLSEIQHLSGCKVEVHKRGSNSSQGLRLVSLSGNVDNIRNSRMMIERVINEEQSRRQQHGRAAF